MPKRIGYILIPEKVTVELCERAILKAAKGKMKRRIVRRCVQDVYYYAVTLRWLLLSGTYEHGPYKERMRKDPGSGKLRTLEIPEFWVDQCVHHVILLLLEEEFVKRYDVNSASCVPGRGTHYFYKRLKRYLTNDRKGTKYAGQGDVKKCYDHIRPEIVLAALGRFIKDPNLMRILAKILYSHPCLPLGNVVSSWFQNLVCTALDRVLRTCDGVKYYLRYADDFLFLGPNKRKLHRAMAKAREVLAQLGLTVKSNYQVFPVDKRGIDIVGYRFFRYYILLRKRNLLSLVRTFRKYRLTKSVHSARGLLSKMGGLKWSYADTLQERYFKYLDINELKRSAHYENWNKCCAAR